MARAVTLRKEEGQCEALSGCLPTTWQVPRSGACRYLKKGGNTMSVNRIYVEKKPEFAVKAHELKEEISNYLGLRQLVVFGY